MSAEPQSNISANHAAALCLNLTKGSLLSEALIAAGESIALPCSGRGSCGKCRAVVKGAVAPPTELEQQHLSPADIAAGIRLTCQARSLGGEVQFFSLPQVSDYAILVEGYPKEAARDSNLELTTVDVSPSNHHSLSEWDRIQTAGNDHVGKWPATPPLTMLRALPAALSESGGQVEIACFAGQPVSVRPSGRRNRYYGVAFDIGTTTMVGYLVNLRSGQVMTALPRSNPQAAHGADVMSRICYAEQAAGLARLQAEVTAAMAEMATTMALQKGLSLRDIVAITAVGNTCMHHLLLGIPPARLGQSPYLPVGRSEMFVRGSDIGLAGFADSLVWTGPIIGGFVGADAVAAGVAGQLLADDQPRLLIDLGTNGEILLSAKGRILACSAAAGPAFEGVQISCGMRAEQGAIDGVSFTPDGVQLHVLGKDAAPRGICGSGLIDAVAEMLRTGVIDETGRFNSAAEVAATAGPHVAAQVDESGQATVFRLAPGVELTQGDIREVQLAKGAIRAAIEVCCSELGISSAEISEVLLAGAFGTYIRKDNAVRIGLLPELPLRQIRSIGNAAGAGAILALTSQAARANSVTLAARAEHIDLGGHPAFQERFVDAMLFM